MMTGLHWKIRFIVPVLAAVRSNIVGLVPDHVEKVLLVLGTELGVLGSVSLGDLEGLPGVFFFLCFPLREVSIVPPIKVFDSDRDIAEVLEPVEASEFGGHEQIRLLIKPQ